MAGERAALAAKALGLKRVGVADAASDEFSSDAGIIYRLKNPPPQPVKYDYLTVSENVGDISRIDILVLGDFRRVKDKLKKKSKGGAGVEITVEQARKQDATGIARWVADAYDLYKFCQSSGFQFILSSGASSPHGIVSGQSFDVILKMVGIDPQKHWSELAGWLASRLE
ncbi:MAG TPA: hypothetical protein VHA09_03545, partial [Nitrososphaera sp.]|nr:hypothetical protein [Nitrososphaera sp.]